MNIFRKLSKNFCENLDKSFHVVSKNIMVNKGFRIFVFLSEAILSFVTAVALLIKKIVIIFY
jgi:hypothetical protein